MRKTASRSLQQSNGLNSSWLQIKKMRIFYLMLIIPVAWTLIFSYKPMYGVIIAFKDFKMGDGIIGSPWNNFRHFEMFFTNYNFIRVLRNTIYFSFLNIIFGFPAPIILALLLNEIRKQRFKKIVQSISYLPHFLSWVILATFLIEILSPSSGLINYILSLFRIKPIYFLASRQWFRPVIVLSGIWQSIGWGSIVYLAAISSVNMELYDSANIDGANRLQKAFYITLPAMMPVITFFAIMNMANVLRANFDQIFNLLNDRVMEVGDVIDTYIYRVGLVGASYDYAAAVGLFVNVVGLILLTITNTVVRRYSDYTLW